MDYMTTKELAKMTGFTEDMFQNLRKRGEGPPYDRIGRNVRYRRADVMAWFEELRVNTKKARDTEPRA